MSARPLSRRFCLVVLAVIVLNRLAFDAFVAPLPDEAYYWLWGQRPGLSYYDHAPLQAWLQGLSSVLFGQNLFALRAMTWVTTALSLGVIWHNSRRFGADALDSVTLFMATPILFIFTTMVFHDHLLIALLLLAGSLFLDVFAATAKGEPVPFARLYGAAIILGLAGLTKYNAALFGLGIAATVLVTPSLRPLLRSPHLYCAAVITILMQSPVIYWNWLHDFASFRFNLDERLSTPRSFGKGLGTLAIFIGIQMALLSPFAVCGLWHLWRNGPISDVIRLWRRTCLVVLALALGLFGLLCFRGQIHYYWGLVGFILLFLAPSLWLKAGRVHAVYGCIVISLFTFNDAALPLTALVGKADAETALAYGWDEIAARMETAGREHKTRFIIGTHYRIAAQLAFAMKRNDIESIAETGSQFTIWHDAKSRAGRDAIILADDMVPLGEVVRGKFASVVPLEDIIIRRVGLELKRYRVYRAIGYLAP